MNDVISVVVVESQHIMRTALSTAIMADGMAVLAEVTSSRDAVQIASKLNPDLVLFSVDEFGSLGDLERISLLRKSLPKSIIVALITGDLHGQFQMARDYGAHLVLTKSASRAELLTSIKKALNAKSIL